MTPCAGGLRTRPIWLNGEDAVMGDPGPRLHPREAPAPSQWHHGIASLPSRPASGRAQQGDAAGKPATEVQAPARPWAAASRSGREPVHGPRGIAGLQTSLLCAWWAFPASARPFPPLDVVAGKPNLTSLKSLSQSIMLKTALSLD